MARRRRQDAEIERAREHILDAAGRAFARTGYRATTMAVIATEAGYTPPTLYTYFKGKQDIYEALIAVVMGEVMATYEERQPSGLQFAQRLELLLIRQFEIVDRRSDVFAFFLTAASRPEGTPARKPSKRRRADEDEGEVHMQRLVDWIAEATKDDPLRDADPQMLATFLNGINNAFLTRWVRGGRHRRAVELVPTILALFLGGARGLQHP